MARARLRRRDATGGALVAAVIAIATLFSGISGNWVAALGQPPDAVVWAVFAVAVAATAVLTVVAARAGRVEPDATPVPVSVAGAVDSTDTGWDVWALAEFTPTLATVHTAIGRRWLSSEPERGEVPVPYVPRNHDAALRADLAAAARGEHRALVLLRGGSSTGKTRSLYEAVHTICAAGRRARRWRRSSTRRSQAPTECVVASGTRAKEWSLSRL